MEYTPKRVLDLTNEIPWAISENIRILWVQLPEQNRVQFAEDVRKSFDGDAIVPIVLRRALFVSANAVLSDVSLLFDESRDQFALLSGQSIGRITVLILAKEPFLLPQISSPIVLPTWFPILGGQEVFLKISDLEQQANVALLNCPEARAEDVSKLIFDLESSITELFIAVLKRDKNCLSSVFSKLFSENTSISPSKITEGFAAWLGNVHEPRMYRPPAKKIDSLTSRLLYLFKTSSPDQIGAIAISLGKALDKTGTSRLKPTFFATMFRPDPNVCHESGAINWHSILVAVFQGYHLMNGTAHAGEYGTYPVGLIYSSSLDLRRFLRDAIRYVDSLRRDQATELSCPQGSISPRVA